jgi:hypothetical protein
MLPLIDNVTASRKPEIIVPFIDNKGFIYMPHLLIEIMSNNK